MDWPTSWMKHMPPNGTTKIPQTTTEIRDVGHLKCYISQVCGGSSYKEEAQLVIVHNGVVLPPFNGMVDTLKGKTIHMSWHLDVRNGKSKILLIDKVVVIHTIHRDSFPKAECVICHDLQSHIRWQRTGDNLFPEREAQLLKRFREVFRR